MDTIDMEKSEREEKVVVQVQAILARRASVATAHVMRDCDRHATELHPVGRS